MKCAYCGNPELSADAKKCAKCGAPVEEAEPSKIEKGAPFLYRGYILWPLRDLMRDVVTVQFWLGDRLVNTISLSRMALDSICSVAEDPTELFYQLHKVATGEEECLRIEQQNVNYPATFEVRRIEHPDKQRWLSLSREDLYKMAKRGELRA